MLSFPHFRTYQIFLQYFFPKNLPPQHGGLQVALQVPAPLKSVVPHGPAFSNSQVSLTIPPDEAAVLPPFFLIKSHFVLLLRYNRRYVCFSFLSPFSTFHLYTAHSFIYNVSNFPLFVNKNLLKHKKEADFSIKINFPAFLLFFYPLIKRKHQRH